MQQERVTTVRRDLPEGRLDLSSGLELLSVGGDHGRIGGIRR